jgi:BirA family biotin operon repressor/biotin-[acetyl-CoA-carboxylase] ligase
MSECNEVDIAAIEEQTFVRRVEYHREVDSTNVVAVRLVRNGSCETPCLVIAKRQLAGRGRGSKVWWSNDGALTMSLILELAIGRERLPIASLLAGLAICQALEKFAADLSFSIKWPNDVFVRGRKICGILIESPVTVPERIVVGIGINLNNSMQLAPADIRETAIAMIDCLDAPLRVADVLIECLKQLERRFFDLQENRPLPLDEWRRYDMLRDRCIDIELPSETIHGFARGIDSCGRLAVDTAQGRVNLLAGTVARVRGDR